MKVPRVGRNDPCPCGSGKKYKNCHEGRDQGLRRRVAGLPLWMLLALGVAGAIAVVTLLRPLGRAPGATSRPAAGVPGGGPEPAPWFHDAATNQHWDPTHRHWHPGPPPIADSLARAVPPPAPSGPAGQTPAPYTYDPASNQHWDPEHGHWHPGPPPARDTARAGP